MAAGHIMFVIKIRWWFVYLYLPGVFAMCRLLDYFGIEYEPNWQRIEFWAVRAVTVEQRKPIQQAPEKSLRHRCRKSKIIK